MLLLPLAAGVEAGRSDAEDASVRVSESVVVVVFAWIGPGEDFRLEGFPVVGNGLQALLNWMGHGG